MSMHIILGSSKSLESQIVLKLSFYPYEVFKLEKNKNKRIFFFSQAQLFLQTPEFIWSSQPIILEKALLKAVLL